MPHHSSQMGTFADNYKDKAKLNSFEVVETPTYLLARDEDCENSFHATADFVS